jgi:hypothetical protein
VNEWVSRAMAGAREAELARAVEATRAASDVHRLDRHRRRAASSARRAWTPAEATALAALTGRTAPPPKRLPDRIRLAVRVLVAR